jgi:hypothetical protein
MKTYGVLLSVLSMLILFNSSLSQSKVGTTIGQFLKIEPSARTAAMGNAGVSVSGEATAAYYNPASLGQLQNSSIQFTHSRWLADINYDYLAAAVRIGRLGTFLMQVTALNSDEIDVRTVDQPLGTGERYSVSNFAFGIGYGRMLTDRVAIGLQTNYIRETIWHSSLAGVGFNLGVQFQLSQSGIMLGASISNFGNRTGYSGRDMYVDYDLDPAKHGDNDQLPASLRTEEYSLPTLFRVGFSWPVKFSESNQLLFAIDAMHPNDNSESLNLGAEWMILDNFALRGGFRNLFLDDIEGGVVLGAGLNINISNFLLNFDYAWADYGLLDTTQRLTLGLGF